MDLYCAACVSGAAWLGLLVCLFGWYMCLCGGVGWGVVVWLSCGTGCVLVGTAVPLPERTWGHRTQQTTMLLEVSLSFLFLLASSPFVIDTFTKTWQ